MPPTADALLEEMIQKGLQKVAEKDLVKGCDYLLMYPGVDNPAWVFKMAKYVEGLKFSNWRDYVKLDKDGDPLFEYPPHIPKDTKLPAYGAHFYTYNPFKCDAELMNARRRFNQTRSKSASRNRNKSKTRSANRMRG